MLLRHQRTYSYEDVCQIAKHQMKEWRELVSDGVSEKGGERGCEGVGKGIKGDSECSCEKVSESSCEKVSESSCERRYEGVSQNRCVVMDTEWIVTQVWFEEVYGQTPNGWELPALYAAGAQKRDSHSLNPKSGAESIDSGAESIDSGAKSRDSGAKIRFLLTAPDIEWVADPVRENGSDERRWYLFHRYEAWLQKIGAQYEIVWHKQV